MGLIGRLRAAWAALVSDEHDNESHRYGIVIGVISFFTIGGVCDQLAGRG